MVDLTTRHQLQQDRIKAVKEQTQIPIVKVMPRDEKIRKHIAHMPGNIRFPAEGPAKWPLDTFTRRRIRDGDVYIVDDSDQPQPEPPEPEGGEV